MKKFTFYLMMMVLSLSFIPTQMMASSTEPVTAVKNKKEVPAEVKVLLSRLEEIKDMDKSALTRVERKELRKEVRAIKAELRSTGNGIYLSVGAIIIVILLLILLL